jgi:hypothetical protein
MRIHYQYKSPPSSFGIERVLNRVIINLADPFLGKTKMDHGNPHTSLLGFS